MNNLELYKEDIQKRMEQLDQRANLEFSDYKGRFVVIIVGGGALVLRGYITRATDDIDTLDADKRLYGLMEKYDMNAMANAYLNSFLFNYQDRAEHIWSGKKIDYYTASLEDIVVAKICANRGTDIEDLEAVVNDINWDLLDTLVNDEDELRLISMSERGYADFKACYERFERKYRPCED